MKTIFFLLFLILFSNCSHNEEDFIVLQKINIENYINTIDQKILIESIDEGVIMDTSNTSKVGNYETSFFYESFMGKLLKVECSESTDTNRFYTFYYKDSNLIYARLEKLFLDKISKHQNIQYISYYYKGKSLEKKSEISTELYHRGMGYLKIKY